MQTRANRILSMLLALVMVLSMLPATVFAVSETDVLEGWSITLGDDIGVKFYLTGENYTVSTTVNGAAVTPTISGETVTVNVAAAQMTDIIGLTVKNGEETVHTGEYSVRQYAETILTGEYDNEVKAMVKEMLNYGAAAQTYFGYTGNGQANEGYVSETAAAVPTEVPAIAVEGKLSGIGLYGMSLVLRNKTAVRFYFTVSGNIADYTFKVGETAYAPVEKDGKYYVEIGNINPQDLDKDITLSVNDGALSVTYSPMTYIVRKYNHAESSAELKALVQAMYGYHLEALEYQEYQKIAQLGNLQTHGNNTLWAPNANETFIYATIPANVAQDASTYRPLSADVVKLVRGGETFSVGIPACDTLEVINQHSQVLIKLAAWTISGSKLPLQAHDYLIIEGRFATPEGVTLQINKTYIYYNGNTVEISTEVPTLPTTVEGGTMLSHSNTDLGANGLYFKMEANAAPYNSNWSYEYKQTSVDGIKRIRNGETTSIGIVGRPLFLKYSETEYYLKLEGWTLGENATLQTNDILVIEGEFYHEASKTTLKIAKSYIYYDGSKISISSEMPKLPTTVEGGVMMKVDGYGWTGGTGDLIFKMDNTAPNGGYKPTSASNIKLIRNGETYDIAYVGQNVINKDNDGWYSIPFWTIVNYKPMLANDVLVIEGDFYQESTKTTLNVSKTYVLLNEGGSAEFSTEMPTLPTTVEGGVMMKVEGYGWTGGTGDLIFKMDNTAPNGGYKPTSAGNIKLIRNGETYDVAYVGVEIFNKSNDGWYNIPFWTIVNYKPMLANDILVIEGDFYQESTKTTLNVSKTYVLLKDGGAAEFFTEMPSLETVVDCGVMSEHADGNASEIYFTLAENIVPVDEELAYPYAGTVQLVSGSNTSTVNANIYKLDADMYYLELDGAELSDGSYLIVEGAFSNADNGYTMNISKTYVLADGENLVFSTTEPEIITKIYAGTMNAHASNGWNGDALYFSMAENEAPIGDAIRYKPAAASNIKLIRDGATYDVGHTARETIVKASETGYYIALWVLGDYKPLKENDILIVEGDFTNANQKTLNISKTYILINADGTARFSTEMPTLSNIINAGMMSAHSSNGWNGDALYFSMAENVAPVGDAIRYKPENASNIKLIRDGATYDVGHNQRETIVKASETGYYIALWVLGDYKPLKENDILIVEGDFTNAANNTTLNISKTYILINADGTATFSATEPVPSIKGGMMQAYSENKWHSTDKANAGNLWFALDDNNAPTGAYRPTDAANIKLIRGGETYVVGHTGRDTISKINNGWYVFEFWTIADHKPMVAGDILIVEGDFYQASTDTTLNISKTYVLLNADGSASYSDTEPSNSTVIDAGLMIKLDGYGWNADNLYFKMAANDAPDNAGYQPTDASCIKVIRNGETVNDAMVGQDVINKANDGWYNVAFWTFVNTKPLQAGDILVFEGDFYNAANDTILRITKTYAQLNADGTVTFFDDSDMYINAGGMNAYTQGWFNNGFFFTMEANNAPAGSLDENNGGDWTVEYTPSSAAVIKLVRDGVATEIAMVDRGTITKLTDTVYYFRIDSWATPSINNKANLRDGDMLVVEGEFYGKPDTAAKDYTLNISKSYIIFTSMEDEIITFSTGAETEFGDVVLPSSNKTLNIGMWNGSYHIFTNDRLAELQAAGITKIMGIDPQWTGAEHGGLKGMLDRAAAYNIDVIVDLRGWDGTANYAWTNSNGEAVCYLQDVVNHPALMGFIMFDEPSTSDFDKLAELKVKFDAVMPADKLFFVNLYGSSAAASSLGIISYIQNYETHYVQKFLDKLGVEVLSWDSYPLVDVDGMRTGYFQNFEIMASKGVPLWYTMLSSGHNTTVTHYETPTAEDLRWQMAVAMTYGVQNIDHYIYASHEDDYTCMFDLDTNAVTDLYYDIKDVNNEYLAWDNIYMAYNWVGVGKYSANNNDAMLDALTKCVNLANYGVSAVSANENLLIGVFDHAGSKAYMVTNAGSTTNQTVGDGKKYSAQDATVTLTLDAADYKCVAIIDNGEISYVAVENNTVTLNVEAFEGVFVIPVLN